MFDETKPSPREREGLSEQRIASPVGQKETLEGVAKEMGLEITLEPSKTLKDMYDVVFQGTMEDTKNFIKKVRVIEGEKNENN